MSTASAVIFPRRVTMSKNASNVFIPATQSAQEYAQQLMGCTSQLARSQLDVTESIYNEVKIEYRGILKSEDLSAMFRNWPKMLEKSLRSTVEGSASMIFNAIGFQKDIIQLMQNSMPEINRQFLTNMAEARSGADAA